MPDEVLPCVDCRTEFTFTESEATFFSSKGLSKPRRCKPCRQKRRDAKAGNGAATLVPPPRQEVQWVNAEEEAPRKNSRKRRRDYDRGL